MPRARRGWRGPGLGLARGLASATVVLSLATVSVASTPRWTTGPPYFTVSNTPVIWYVDRPLYYTDPGDLSASVNHAAADAMVAAAASVWNVPSARMVLAQGGSLDEQVSGANVYPGPNGLVFPADMSSANYAAKQIAIVYDRDGSVTDLLMGSGASDPTACRDSAVTESVDAITPTGLIQHAVLILNGRCTGPAQEQQMQMQYQLERAFGRVLGLGWSQLNDNVFTGTPQPTYAQALHWPIMHPIDVICGPYSYQCLPQPFTLRDDDIASITMLYPVTGGTVPFGKQLSTTNAATLDAGLYFPTGEGMAGVNVVIRRNAVPSQVQDGFDDVSAVTGIFMEQVGATPIAAKPTGTTGSLGSLNPMLEKDFGFTHDTAGYFYFPRVPIIPGLTLIDELFRTEPINPLYIGAYSVGPYRLSTVEPSGTSVTFRLNGVGSGYYAWRYPVAHDAASTCATSGDGTSSAPSAVPPGGWWTDVICGANGSSLSFAHSAWSTLPVRANRSLTVEVTGLDEAGYATVNKVRPVIGVASASDPNGSIPSVATAATAFNSVVLGMTSVTAQRASPDTLRVAISDERGDGRPDYAYQARVLYADTILPAVGTKGTQVTIHGTGFRTGNAVTVNGVAAKVSSWTSTTIVAAIPFVRSVLPGTTVAMDVSVSDLSTTGATVMGGAFQYAYTAAVYGMQLVSAPSGNVPMGVPATPSFVVRMIDADGVSPLAGTPVVFSATAGSVTWSACGGALCTVVTDANGLAAITATPTALGPVTLQAAALGTVQAISFSVVPLVRTVLAEPSIEYVAAGVAVSWGVAAQFSQQGLPAAGLPVTWSGGAGSMIFSAIQPVTDANGSAIATATAGPLAGGVQALGTVCGWSGICGSLLAQGVDPTQFVVQISGGAGQSISAAGSLAPVSIEITDGAGHAVAGAAVQVHQTVNQWTAPCPVGGRCPTAPVYGASNTAAVSDSNGLVTVIPLQIAGAEVTDVVVTSGTQGFVSFTLQKDP